MPTAEHDQPAQTTRATCTRVIVSGEIEQEVPGLREDILEDRDQDRLIWVDLVNPERETIDALARIHQLHPLAAKEVYKDHRGADLSMFDRSAYIVIHVPFDYGETIRLGELEVIIGEGFFVTIHDRDYIDIDVMIEHWQGMPASWRSTSNSLLYAVFRTILFTFAPVADHLDDALEKLQREAIRPHNHDTPKRELLYQLFHLTEQITDLHNMVMPFKDMLIGLKHNSDWLDEEGGNAWSRDVEDDAVHLANRMQMLRDTAQRLFEMVNSLITLQRTDVSKQLTIVATIFLPLSFIGAYFGQNFQYMEDSVASGQDFLVWGAAVPVVSLVIIFLVMWKFGAFR